MNAKDIKDIKDVRNVVEKMEGELSTSTKGIKDILICLKGDPKNRDDLGLVGDVRNNKRWKNVVNKWLGIFGVSTVGLLAKQIFELFKK